MARTPNRLLTGLRGRTGVAVDQMIERIALQRGTILSEAGEHLEFVHFPEDCVLSLLSVLTDGAQVETATIGHEGAFGALASLGRPIASCRCMVQVEGAASRVPVSWLQNEFAREPKLVELFVRYAQATIFQIQQSAACNATHSVERRLARWLLEMSDRGGRARLELTHEFLAGILGANRATVSTAAAALQEAECIAYHRGVIEVLNRKGLESACCECYAAVREHGDLLLGAST
jgi:CRP-like cAMP-binding protein